MAKNGFSMSNRVAVEQLTTATKILTADDCGKVFVITSADAGGVVTITMPDAAAADNGWNVELLFESGSTAANQNVVVSSSAGTPGTPFKFRALTLAATATGFAAAGNAITHSAGNQQTGDLIKIVNVEASQGGYFWSVQSLTSASFS
jgi:hypothetical protein